MFPIEIFQTELRHFTTAQPVDREKHQHAAIADVAGLIAVCTCDESLNISPGGSTWKPLLSENTGALNGSSNTGVTPRALFRMEKERSEAFYA
jgi:hypothetical protein